jgi:hypothetical protein
MMQDETGFSSNYLSYIAEIQAAFRKKNMLVGRSLFPKSPVRGFAR